MSAAADYPSCTNESNAILACYPESDTEVPLFIGAGAVDVYAHDAGSEEAVTSWLDVTNGQGHVPFRPRDDWFPTQTTWTEGQTSTLSYYFVVATAGKEIDGSEPHQATFSVLQTAPPSSLTASLASASSLASSLSAHADEFSSLASANAYETTLSDGSVVTVTPTPFVSTLSNGDQTTVTPTPSTSTMSDGRTTVVFSPTPNDGSLQDDSDDDGGGGTPIWAIVVPIILGILFLLALLSCIWLLLTRRRRRRDQRLRDEPFSEPNTPTGPMKQAENDAQMHETLLAAGGARRTSQVTEDSSKRDSQRSSSIHRAVSPEHDRLFLASKKSSAEAPLYEENALTGDDAIHMAAAFRNALRKPSFVRHVDSDDSNGTTKAIHGASAAAAGSGNNGSESMSATADTSAGDATFVESPTTPNKRDSVLDPQTAEGRRLLDKELASEGTSLRSLDTRKKPALQQTPDI